MNTLEKENAIRAYFEMWVQRDFTFLATLFTPNIFTANAMALSIADSTKFIYGLLSC